MATYSIRGLFDFILFIIDQEQEDIVWEIWLADGMKEEFRTFKNKRMNSIRKKKVKRLSIEQEKVINNANSRFIKPREGGENE